VFLISGAKKMKLTHLLMTIVLAGLFNVWDAPLKMVNPQLVQASAQMKGPTDISADQKIEIITKNKGQIGSGDQLRRYFYGDLEPLGVQPGGAGMVVNLYNKANDVTFSYCATFDVVVAARKGKVKEFPAAEVK
jgi:hypothetical protein